VSEGFEQLSSNKKWFSKMSYSATYRTRREQPKFSSALMDSAKAMIFPTVMVVVLGMFAFFYSQKTAQAMEETIAPTAQAVEVLGSISGIK
jgi:hypothetical protein